MSDDSKLARTMQMEAGLARLLRAGVVVSIVLLAGGIAVSFMRHPEFFTSPAALSYLTDPGEAFPHSMRTLAAELRQGRGRALMTFGLLVLIATPVLRVSLSVIGFARLGDRRYTLLTALVLLNLLISFLLGGAE